MALQAAAYVVVNPSFSEPEILLQNTQPSGFVHTLADGQLRQRLGEEDLLVYMRQLQLRTKIAAGQASSNELPGVDITAGYISTQTYRFQVRADWNHHDVNAAANWGFSLTEAYSLGCRQAHFQLCRDASLKGMNPQNGEGLLNGPTITNMNLPPDPYDQDTFSTYDNGAAAFLFMLIVGEIKTRTLNLGIGQKFTVIGPQRDLVLFEYNVVQLVQYQREGAGTNSTSGTFKDVLMKNGDSVIWTYDDTLIGAGQGGNDAIVFVMPELVKPGPPGGSSVNTNEFAGLLPGANVNVTQYCDMAAPREIISPLAGGATDFLTEWRNSSGWAVRGEAVTVLSGAYSS